MTSVYTFTDDQLLHAINRALVISVEGLRKEGYITQEQSNDICTNYSLILESKKWLPVFLGEMLRLKDDGLSLRLVKAVGREKE